MGAAMTYRIQRADWDTWRPWRVVDAQTGAQVYVRDWLYGVFVTQDVAFARKHQALAWIRGRKHTP